MLETPPKRSVGCSHSKLILVGEHAVVYGKPAIALPFPVIEATSTIEEVSGTQSTKEITIDCLYFVGPLKEVPEKMSGIVACIYETFKSLNEKPEGIHIRLTSTIPVGRGLGSSAAVAIAIVKGLYTYHEQELTQEKLMRLVHVAETYAHGNPSGLDMAAASSEHPILFQREKKLITLQTATSFHLVVADTGRIGDTRMVVESIREKYQLNPASTQQSINLLEKLTNTVKEALLNGKMDSLGEALNSAQTELINLGVSDPGIDNLVQTARDAGALGAKLTGGGRGGCIIALAKNNRHADMLAHSLKAAGAYQTWEFKVGEN